MWGDLEGPWLPRKQREDRRVVGLGLLWPRGSGPILRRGRESGTVGGGGRLSEQACDLMTLSIVQSVSNRDIQG